MAGFGGAIKLTGAGEYRDALARITQNVKENASAMQLLATQYDSTDRSEEAVTARTKALNDVLATQREKLRVLQDQYANLAPRVQEQGEQHRKLVERYEAEKQKLDTLEHTLGKASEEYKNQQSVVEDLAYQVGKSTSANEANERSLSAIRTQMNLVQAEANGTAKKIDELGNETEESGGKAKKSAEGGWTIFKDVIADLSSKAIQSAIRGLQQLGSQFVQMGKQSMDMFGEYEQQVGGIYKIFDQQGDATVRTMAEMRSSLVENRKEMHQWDDEVKQMTGAEMMIENAQNAFKTVGLNANEYMQTVTSFSASLMQGLGGDTVRASEMADVAMRDMADNMNAFGTSMDSIRSAYAGFAKDNYTMLDNLKLGYGGNATEMARLINDSKVLGDSVEVTAKTVKDVPFDKIIEAIHVTQQNIGILGTTTAEASNTIQGSTRAMRASWQNLLIGMADDQADFERLVDDFISTLDDGNGGGALSQILPRVTQVINGISKAIQTLVPTLVKMVAPMITNNLPVILKAVQDALKAILELLPTIMPTIQALIPQVVMELVNNLPLIIDTGIKIILALIQGIIDALPQLIAQLPIIVQDVAKVLADNFPLIVRTGVNLLGSLAKGIWDSLGDLLGMVKNVNNTISDGLSAGIKEIFTIGKNIVMGLWEGIQSWNTWLTNKVKNWVQGIVNNVKNLFGIKSPSKVFRDEIGENLALGIGEGFSDEMQDVSKMMADSIPQSFDINPSLNGSSVTSSYDMVGAFKEALSQMKIELDDEVAGRFVENTVARAIYA